MPRQRQREAGVADHRRIDDDVLSESALVSLLLLYARGEDSAPVPVAILVLPYVHDWMLRLEMAEKNSAVKKIPRVVLDRNWPRGEEDGVLVIFYLNRVDRHAGEESATHVADVHFPLDVTFEHRQKHLAHARLAEAGVRDADDAEDDDHHQSHQDDGAADYDAEPARHGKLERLSDGEAESKPASEAAERRRLVRRRTPIGGDFLCDRNELRRRIDLAEVGRQIVIRAHAQERRTTVFGPFVVERSLRPRVRVVPNRNAHWAYGRERSHLNPWGDFELHSTDLRRPSVPNLAGIGEKSELEK